MSQRNIDFGAFPDDPDADAIRTAFQKVQQNFTELYSGAGSGVTSIVAGQGIQLGGTGSPTGAVTIEATIACIQVQSSTLSLGILGSTSDESYVFIPSSSQILTVDLPANIVAENLELTGNLSVTGDINFGNSVTANYFIGDGGLLSNIVATAGSSIDNGNSNVTVIANANVTVSVSGNPNIAEFSNSGLNVSGNVAATYFIGDGGLLSNISGVGSGNSITNGTSNVVVSASGNVTTSVSGISNVLVVTSAGTNVAGTITASGNITGANLGIVGRITTGTLTVTGNANVGNIGATNGVFTNISGNGAALTSITGANVTGTVSSATTAGTVTTAAQPNITSVGTLTSLAVTGNATAANFTGNHFGNGSGLSSITGANVTGTVANATNALVANTVDILNTNGLTTTFYPTFVENRTTGQTVRADVDLTYRTDTNTLTVGNIIGGNSISANFFQGDGGLLTNISAVAGSQLVNGNSNVAVDANSNVRISVSGVANVVNISNTNISVSGNIIPTSNVAYNLGSSTNRFKDLYLSGNTIYLGGLVLSDTENDFAVTGNITAQNANLGNAVRANYFIGDGGLLSNITAVVTSANTANTANTANIANSVVGYTKVPFQYNSSSPVNIAVIPAGSVVNQIMIVITQAFSDASATLTVGTIADPSQLVAANDLQPNQTGTYVIMPGQLYLSNTQVVLSITPGSSTTGNGMLIINY